MVRALLVSSVVSVFAFVYVHAHHDDHGKGGSRIVGPPPPAVTTGAVPCVDGLASGYTCAKIDLLSFLPLAMIGGGRANTVWEWTDSTTGREYALLGRTNGTSFVDITDPEHPVYLGNLPPHGVSSTWREMKVYADHAFIVSEAANHGLQVFDLRQLRTVVSPPVTFAETAHYAGFGHAHNIALNEETGFATHTTPSASSIAGRIPVMPATSSASTPMWTHSPSSMSPTRARL